MIIDIYTHIFPERFFQELERGSPKLGNMGKRLRSIPKLFNLDLRFFLAPSKLIDQILRLRAVSRINISFSFANYSHQDNRAFSRKMN